MKYLQYVHAWTVVYITFESFSILPHLCGKSILHEDWQIQAFFLQLNPNIICPSPSWICFLVGFLFFSFWLLYDLGEIHKYV